MLDDTGEALASGDFEGFQRCFRLPQTLSNQLGMQTVETPEELRQVFERVRWHFRGLKVTEIERRVMASMYVDGRMILSAHVTRLLRHGTPIREPFKVLSTLSMTDGQWQISDCDYAVKNSLGHSRALFGPCPMNDRSGQVAGLSGLF